MLTSGPESGGLRPVCCSAGLGRGRVTVSRRHVPPRSVFNLFQPDFTFLHPIHLARGCRGHADYLAAETMITRHEQSTLRRTSIKATTSFR